MSHSSCFCSIVKNGVFLTLIRATAFLEYLLNLREDSSGIMVCRHFRRVATDDRTESWTTTFLTGQPSDLVDEETQDRLCLTTALHEAVKASNYAVVEYLTLTDFVVQAEDENGQTALDLAVGFTNSKMARKPVENKRIIALLQQNKDIRIDPKLINAGLPLGWEPCLADGHDYERQIWRETSIESDHDAITFLTPKVGLWQDQRIALGQRKAKGNKGQVYYLDPLRFLRSRRHQIGKPSTATEPHFSDQWFINDIKKTLKPPTDPRDDERTWYRNTAKAWFALRHTMTGSYSNAFIVFLPFSFLSRFLHWNKEVQMVFHIFAISFMMSGFPHPSVAGTLPAVPSAENPTATDVARLRHDFRSGALFDIPRSFHAKRWDRELHFSNVLLDCLPEMIVSWRVLLE